MKWWLILTLPLYALDQVTKWLVLQHIRPDETVPVIAGWFYLVQLHNTGAAFSMLRDNNVFFVALSSVALVILAIFWRRGSFRAGPTAIGAALLAAGILGNLTDRIVHHFVVDFLLVDLHVWMANPWPAFNVADSCICIAAAIFVISSFLDGKNEKVRASSQA